MPKLNLGPTWWKIVISLHTVKKMLCLPAQNIYHMWCQLFVFILEINLLSRKYYFLEDINHSFLLSWWQPSLEIRIPQKSSFSNYGSVEWGKVLVAWGFFVFPSVKVSQTFLIGQLSSFLLQIRVECKKSKTKCS